MDLLLPLLPVSWRPYAKAILAALGAALYTAVALIPDLPSWVGIAVGIATALGVYAQPNATADPSTERSPYTQPL